MFLPRMPSPSHSALPKMKKQSWDDSPQNFPQIQIAFLQFGEQPWSKRTLFDIVHHSIHIKFPQSQREKWSEIQPLTVNSVTIITITITIIKGHCWPWTSKLSLGGNGYPSPATSGCRGFFSPLAPRYIRWASIDWNWGTGCQNHNLKIFLENINWGMDIGYFHNSLVLMQHSALVGWPGFTLTLEYFCTKFT